MLSDTAIEQAFCALFFSITEYTVNGILLVVLGSKAISQHLLNLRHCSFL